MAKELKFSRDARNNMLEGIKYLYDATRVTIGPKGRNVIIEQDFGTPIIVNDGVTIAKAIELSDKFANMGAQIIIEAASKTNDAVGDGTTTAIILASNLIIEGVKALEEGVNPVDLKKGFTHLEKQIVDQLDKVSVPVTSLQDLERVAIISSGSESIGKLISAAYAEVGIDGVITIEESRSLEDSLEIVKGYSYDKGYMSPYMVTDEQKQLTTLENPYVLITDKKIISMQEILPYLELAVKNIKPIIIICDDIANEVLNAIIVNKIRGVFNCVVTRSPGFGEKKMRMLEDLAHVTNAHIIDEFTKETDPNNLGSAKKVIITKDETTIIDGAGDENKLFSYVNKLKADLETISSTYEKNNIKERIAKILSGVAVIKVASATETELKDKKLRMEDALNATRAASVSGIIEGAGKVFYEISSSLDMPTSLQNSFEALTIFKKALQAPFKQIVENAGGDLNKIMPRLNHHLWYNAESGEIVSLMESGIIDPTSVAKSSLINAVSIASIFLTTECAIVNHQEKNHNLDDLM